MNGGWWLTEMNLKNSIDSYSILLLGSHSTVQILFQDFYLPHRKKKRPDLSNRPLPPTPPSVEVGKDGRRYYQFRSSSNELRQELYPRQKQMKYFKQGLKNDIKYRRENNLPIPNNLRYVLVSHTYV